MSTGALEAVDRILNRGGDADDVLREIVRTIVERAGAAWAGIFFVESGELVLGPEAGEPDESRRRRAPIAFKGDEIGELAADGDVDQTLLDRVALLVSPYCLVGWDTGGVSWDELGA